MATPYIQLLSKRSISEQLQRHHDQSNLILNVEDIIKTQTTDYNNALSQLSEEQAEIMRACTTAICGTLEEGFNLVTNGLHGVENAIYQLTDTLETHLKMMVEVQRYNNILSENIALLLRVPDSQKERQVNIEKGLKFFNDSLRDPSIFEYSLKFFKNAEKEDDTDYFVLDKIGLVYLMSPQDKNYDEAIKYFTKAVKFSKLDTHPNSIRLANILVGDISQPLHKQNATIDSIKYLTGKSLLWISIAYYEQRKFTEAINFAEEAFQIAPSLVDAKFNLALSLAASNQNHQAVNVLEPILRENRDYFIRTQLEPVLVTKIEIKDMLEKLRAEAFTEVTERVNRCRVKIKLNSIGMEIFKQIETRTALKDYLNCEETINLLNQKYDCFFQETIKKNESDTWEAKIYTNEKLVLNIEELITHENLLTTKLPFVKKLIEEEKLIVKINQIMATINQTEANKRQLQGGLYFSIIFGLGSIAAMILGKYLMSLGFFSGALGVMLLIVGFLALLGILSRVGTNIKKFSSYYETKNIYYARLKESKSKLDNITEEIREMDGN